MNLLPPAATIAATLAAASGEPPPAAGVQAAVESAVRHAEQRPDVAFPLLAIVTPLAIVAGLVWLVIRFVLPAWREEKQADRDHLSAQFKDLREDALHDAQAVRQHAADQHESLVQHIGEEVRRFSERTTSELKAIGERAERHGELIHRIAAKVGAAIVLVAMGLAGLSVATTYLAVGLVLDYTQTRRARLPALVQPVVASEEARYYCDPRCKPGDYCCADRDHPNRCCPDKVKTSTPNQQSATALGEKPDGGTSSTYYLSLARHAWTRDDREVISCVN